MSLAVLTHRMPVGGLQLVVLASGLGVYCSPLSRNLLAQLQGKQAQGFVIVATVPYDGNAIQSGPGVSYRIECTLYLRPTS